MSRHPAKQPTSPDPSQQSHGRRRQERMPPGVVGCFDLAVVLTGELSESSAWVWSWPSCVLCVYFV